MSLFRPLPILAIFAAAIALPASTDPLLHGLPTWDSGWRDIPTGIATTLTHNIGGDEADYVVDLQFRDKDSLVSNQGVHQRGLGEDADVGAAVGGYWSGLDTSTIKVVRPSGDDHAAQMRVRIWVVPTTDYDSGWTAITPGGTDLTLTHSLGGNPDDYVVDLHMYYAAGSLIHNNGYGGDRYWNFDHIADDGIYWYALEDATIKVHRGAEDTASNQVRVRIWRKPVPDFDSGWLTGSPQSQRFHDLGGPWNDFVVDMQMRDLDGGLGVNHAGYGGDDYDDGARVSHQTGAYWTELNGRWIRLWRKTDDAAADQYRVRIWSSRQPKYDSGWTSVSQGGLLPLTHNLGGDPDTFVVDLQLKDTTGGGDGVNGVFLGGDWRWDPTRATLTFGAYWWYLNDSSIYVLRGTNDQTAEQVRLRIWIATDPEYDSGWTAIPANGTPQTFDHLTGGYNTDHYVVDLGLDDQDFLGLHGSEVGGQITRNGGSLSYRGTSWWDLDTSSVKVTRGADDVSGDQARVRIWRNPVFDFNSGWTATPAGQETSVAHGLGLATDGAVIDLQMDSDEPSIGVNCRGLGGDTYLDSGDMYHEIGARWSDLDDGGLQVWRGADDLHADRTRVRLWRTDASTLIFADGFESGDRTAWSLTTP